MSADLTALAASIAPRAVDAQSLELKAPWGVSVPPFEGGGLYIVTTGRCHFRVRARTVRLEEGEAMFLPVGESHSLVDGPSSATIPMDEFCQTAVRAGGAMVYGGAGAPTRVLTVGFLFERSRPWVNGLSPMVLGPVRHAAVIRWLIASADLLRADLPDAVKAEVVRAVMKTIYAMALAAQSPPKAPWGNDDRLARVYAAMSRQPSRAWTVESLARVAGMSRSSFAEMFARCLGESPIRHLRRLRLEHAQMMRRQGMLQKTIAGTVGYAHVRSLSRAFRRQLG